MVYTQRSRYIHIQINKYLSELYMIFNFRNRDEKTETSKETQREEDTKRYRETKTKEKKTQKRYLAENGHSQTNNLGSIRDHSSHC